MKTFRVVLTNNKLKIFTTSQLRPGGSDTPRGKLDISLSIGIGDTDK